MNSENESPMPVCDMHTDCFALVNGKCRCLDSNDFGDGECPFYKPGDKNTRKQIEADIKLYKKVYDASKKSKETKNE